MAYFDKYGVRYSDDKKTLEWCPETVEGEYVIPIGTKIVGEKAFAHCPNITKIVVRAFLDAIHMDSFEDIPNVVIDGSIRRVREPHSYGYDFPWNFSGWTSFGGGAKAINGYTEGWLTYNNKSKTELWACARAAQGKINIPNSVTTISHNALWNCSNITELSLGENIIQLPNDFSCQADKLTNLEVISVASGNPSYCSINGVLYNKDITTLIRCPKQKKGILHIPNSVKIIGGRAFSGCSSLTSVTIPDSVETIGSEAFFECRGLTSIEIPNSITSIGGSAFKDCSGFTSITIPDSVTSIGDEAFYLCTNLTAITIGENVENLGEWAFFLAHDKEISITWRAKKIKGTAFRFLKEATKFCAVSCDVTSISFGEHVEEIPAFLCEGAQNLKSVIIPDSVKKIGENAFRECTSLATVKMGENVHIIEGGAFGQCSSLTSIEIPSSVTSIGYSAFEDCTALTSLEIPNSVTDIGDGAFAYCSSLTSVELPNSVTIIRHRVFAGCGSLASIEIPNSVTSIWDEVFSYSGLTSVTIPNSVTSIGREAFVNCTNLTSIIIPNSVTEIGKFAFEDCTALTSVEIPNSVTNIDVGAFAGCAGLTSIEIPNSVTCINDSAFANCTALISIKIPNSVTKIGFCAFAGCSSLTSIEIPNSVTNIEESAFNGCISLSAPVYNKHVFAYLPISYSGAYVIPEGINLIAGSAFQKCIGLTSVEIPNSVTNIGDYAFAYCSSLTSIKIPNSVTEIGFAAFFNLTSIQEICIPKGQKARFLQMGLKEYENIIVERDNEELTIMLNLAKAYEFGIGISQNLTQAVLIYTQAAEKGCAEAAYHLAEWYQNGEVLPLDLNKALDLYQQAAKSGYKDAQGKAQKIQQKIEENEKPYYLFFDTETAGLPPKGKYDVPVTNPDFWPRLVQLAWILTDKEGKVLNRKSKIIYPNGFSIPASATAIHHITTEHAMQVGEPLRDVLGEFMRDLLLAVTVVGHNIKFDRHIVGAELYSMDMDYKALMDKSSICTMTSKSIIDYCALPNPNEGYDDYKWPKLSELYRKLFNRDFENAHDALADITATKECFFELKRRGIIKE